MNQVPMEEVRLRLAFERSILNDDQKAQGAKRCWLLLKPKLHKTVASLSAYIIESFKFQLACPFGLSLSMDGYFLPPFESTAIFHDKDIVRVKRKEIELKIDNGNINLLSNGAVDSGDNMSKEEDDHNSVSLREEHKNDSLSNSCMKVTKKRKANISREKSRKQKKQKVATNDNGEKDTDDANEKMNAIKLPTKSPSRSARRKKAKRKWLRELHKLQNDQENQSVHPKASDFSIKNSDDSDKSEESDKVSEDEEEIVPVVIKPGHIRFQSTKTAKDYTQHEEEHPMVKFQWTNSSKKKGQRWGTEKDNNSKWNHTKTATMVEEHEEEDTIPLDFDNMSPYNCSPKVGDVIAYKMIVLSSSWTPEMSSYRVGKIADYDLEIDRIVLVPVEEYPLPRTEEGNEDNELVNLELCYASLVDVRLVNVEKEASNERRQDEGSVLEELRVMVEKKKKEIVEDVIRNGNGECNKKKGFRGLRRGALGPVLDLLRSEHIH